MSDLCPSVDPCAVAQAYESALADLRKSNAALQGKLAKAKQETIDKCVRELKHYYEYDRQRMDYGNEMITIQVNNNYERCIGIVRKLGKDSP